MRRLIGIILFLAAARAAFAQVPANTLTNVFFIAPGGDCTAVACASATKRMCRNSATDLHPYACNTATGFYAALSSSVAAPGSITQVPFNTDGASLGADSGLTYDKVGKVLTIAGGLASPAKVGTNYTMAAPAQPTAVTSATGAATCVNTRTWHFYTACVNAGGVSAISPASAAWVPSPNLKKPTVTKPDTCPANSLGWVLYMSNETDGDTPHLVVTGGSAASLEAAFQSNATTTVTPACSVSGMTYAAGQGVTCTAAGVPKSCCTGSGTGTCTAAQLDLMSLDTTHGYVKASTSSAGPNLPFVSPDVHQLDLSGTVLRYSADSGSTWTNMSFLTRVVNVCPSGCTYATLTAALAANTSTSGAPIEFRVGPGAYSENPSFAGQSNFYVHGSGRGVTVFTGTGQSGGAGVFLLNTAINPVIDGVTVKGQRTIYWCGSGTCGSGAAVGGGTLVVRNSEFITTTNQALEDCLYYERITSGTHILWDNNDCTTNADGLTPQTLASSGDNVTLVSHNSRYFAGSDRASGGAFTMVSTPLALYSIGDIIDWTATNSSTHIELDGFRWLQQVNGCTSGCYGQIVGTTIRIHNQKTGAGGSYSNGVLVDSTVTNPLDVHVLHSDIQLVADSNTEVLNLGVTNNSASAGVNILVEGGRVATSGGSVNTDLNLAAGSGTVKAIVGTDYSSKSSGVNARVDFGLLATAPATCSIGDHYSDTSGADCSCAAANTWEKNNTTGSCV